MTVVRKAVRKAVRRIDRRPALRLGGVGNLLLAPRDFTDDVWIHGSATATADATTAPGGTNTADQFDFVSTLYGFYDATNAAWLTDHPIELELTSEWVEYTREVTTPAGCTELRVYVARADGSQYAYQTVAVIPETSYVLRWWAKSDGSTTDLWNARFVRGSIPTPATLMTADTSSSGFTADTSGFGFTADTIEIRI